jgi:hypothetical protein
LKANGKITRKTAKEDTKTKQRDKYTKVYGSMISNKVNSIRPGQKKTSGWLETTSKIIAMECLPSMTLAVEKRQERKNGRKEYSSTNDLIPFIF